jgi:hypothetical protein
MKLVRRCRALALLIALAGACASRQVAWAAPNQFLPLPGDSEAADTASGQMPSGIEGSTQDVSASQPATAFDGDQFAGPPADFPSGPIVVPGEPTASDAYISKLNWLGLRHSSIYGRHAGLGVPLVGTSWLNRPYYVGGELGPLWITRSIYDDVTPDTDLFGGFYAGCDWDYYWGNELRFDWATPELINEEERDARRTDSLFTWSYSLLYYPWGDSTWRPYWRCGIGDTHVDFPLDGGSRHDEWLLSFPLGIGVKYPLRRWLAARAEFTDYLSVDPDGDLATLNNLTLTFGLEWRFGAHPRSYWPWNPSRHIW